MSLKKFAVVLMTASLVLNAACSSCKKKEVAEAQKAEQVFTFNNYSEPEYLDPALMADSASFNIVVNLFEGLTEYDVKTMEPVPALASHWDISPDGKTYTFHLRPNAKWSDGSALTANDFVYSWRRAVDPNIASRYANILYSIKNAEAISTGKLADLTQLGVSATDEHTLVVELNNPTPYFPALLSYGTFRPVKKEVVEKFAEKWTRVENIVSNGPFMLQEWTPSKQIVMVKNPNYWDVANVKLDKVVALAVEDLETSLKMYLAGEVDFIHDLPTNKIPELKATRSDFQVGPMYGAYYLSFNTKRKPLDDKRVRQALNYAIDRDKLIQVLHKGIPNGSFTPTGAGYVAPEGFTFNPDKARQLLAAAGYINPADFPELTLSYNTNESHKTVMEMVQSMWRENLGLNLKIQNMEWKVFLSERHSGNYDIARDGWIGDYMDPSTFLELHMSIGTNNHTFWANDQYDAYVREAAASLDKAKRYQLYQQAEKIMLDEAPLAPLYTYTREILLNKRVSGLYSNLFDIHPLKSVSVVPSTAEAVGVK